MHTLETEARPHACPWVGRTALTPEQGGMRCRPPRCPAQEQDGEATPPSSDHKPNKAKPEEATQEGGGEGGTKDPGEQGGRGRWERREEERLEHSRKPPCLSW